MRNLSHTSGFDGAPSKEVFRKGLTHLVARFPKSDNNNLAARTDPAVDNEVNQKLSVLLFLKCSYSDVEVRASDFLLKA